MTGISGMRILTVFLLILKLICELNCSQVTHVDHVCSNGVSREQAGMGSGTLTFAGTFCEITITDIPELRLWKNKRIDQVCRLNIIGVRRNGSCYSSQISIDSQDYCVDDSVRDTVINVTDQQVKFSLVSTRGESFTLRYYRGEELLINVYHVTVTR